MKYLFRILLAASAFGALRVSAATTLTLDSFDAGLTTGAVSPDSTWMGNVTFNADSITIGGSAGNDTGWLRQSSVPVNATGFGRVAFTASQGAGNPAGNLVVIQFEDASANFTTVSFLASDFGTTATTRYANITWASGFDATTITGWSVGGGDPTALQDYRMSYYDFSLTAVPEPSAYGLAAAGLIALPLLRRRRR